MKKLVWLVLALLLVLPAALLAESPAVTLLPPRVEAPAALIWTRVATTGPAPRWGAAMAYDAVRDRVVLFGGASGQTFPYTYYDDTWEFDGTSWIQVNTPGSIPAEMIYGRMLWSPDRGRIMLHGGESYFTPQVQQASRPPGTVCGIGTSRSPDTFLQDRLWDWDGLAWDEVTQTPPPGEEIARCGHGFSWDEDYQAPVLYGGMYAIGGLTPAYGQDTYEWHDPGWLQYTDNGPGPRDKPGMVYHAAQTRTVLFGGYNNGTYLNDTWQWGGNPRQWVNSGAATPPSPRSDMGMAYDRSMKQVVLFGGRDATGPLGGTWVLHNNTWTQLSTLTSPEPRYAMVMVYDTARQRFVLFGGASATAQYGDTWVATSFRSYLPAMLRY